ncbi:MAG: septum formation initiator family protein, partial [Lachnospiraceae bacterium]|nr:septum formation initiator family protein [Lachnospiraceae bacterium]
MALVLTLILSVQIVRLYEKDPSRKAPQAELEGQKTEEEQRAADLEEEEEYVGTDEYVEDIARSK